MSGECNWHGGPNWSGFELHQFCQTLIRNEKNVLYPKATILANQNMPNILGLTASHTCNFLKCTLFVQSHSCQVFLLFCLVTQCRYFLAFAVRFLPVLHRQTSTDGQGRTASYVCGREFHHDGVNESKQYLDIKRCAHAESV